jgi:transmembrane sensor
VKENEAIYQLVIKYLSGDITENETNEVFKWINSSDKNKKLFFHIKDIADAVKSKETEILPTLDVWAKISAKNSSRDDRPRKFNLNYIKYAAAFIIAILSGVIYHHQYSKQKQFITITVAANQPAKQIQLPDHSTVWLKPGSSIHYAADFNNTNRLVNLSGDGFFEVAKVLDQNGHRKPFTIQDSKMNIRVLGTSFNVKDQVGQYSVEVRTGVVRVESNTQVKTLHPGDRVQLKGNQLLTDRINADLYLGWTNGEYKFSNTTVEEISELLRANYNCRVEIAHPEKFKNISLSGRINARDEASLLNMISIMLPASVEKHNNSIIIKPLAYD